jgi:Leucine-rich repeat (LRR) protein
MYHSIYTIIIGFCLLLLGACESYDFKVNDKVVYSPAPLFSDYEIPDQALRDCLQQAIADKVVTGPSQLDTLNCSHAGISDLSGLATFTGLTSLKLSSNNIRNLVELGTLSGLQELILDNNQIIDPVPLYQLPALQVLDLSGNPALQCPQHNGLLRVTTLSLPAHCK